jgi:hypothetical protein
MNQVYEFGRAIVIDDCHVGTFLVDCHIFHDGHRIGKLIVGCPSGTNLPHANRKGVYIHLEGILFSIE